MAEAYQITHGFNIVKRFFPNVRFPEKMSDNVRNTLMDVAVLDKISQNDHHVITALFDRHGVGVWGGDEIR